MAHHQKQQDDARRQSTAMQSLLKMFKLSTAPTVPLGEEEAVGEADEPPDDQLSPLHPIFPKDRHYSKAPAPPQFPRRESLLTRAILAESTPEETSPASPLRTASRGMSASSHSAASMASTAELTSDGDLTSPARSATPSPPHPPSRFPQLQVSKNNDSQLSHVVIAPVTKDDKPAVADIGETVVEKTLGRKRCIMFACAGKSPPKSHDEQPSPVKEKKPVETDPPKRKCMLRFACPTRQDSNQSQASDRPKHADRPQRRPSPAPAFKRKSSSDLSQTAIKTNVSGAKPLLSSNDPGTPRSPISPQAFHEFASSHDETDSWVDNADERKPKLTINDCMKKEIAIRQQCEAAEDEAEEEEQEEEEIEAQLDEEENENEDDFAPSDEESDGGNESDDEGGFAESDDESDAGSDYQFWAPSTTTAATSTEHLNLSHFSSRQRSRTSSLESITPSMSTPPPIRKPMSRRQVARAIRMRPGTPELPDSTDFVCGTLDEDRPLEAAYISCREQKKRAKHVPIPQDIDPSFPTTDPEDEEDNDDVDEDFSQGAGGPSWLKDQFTGFDDDSRSRHVSPPLHTLTKATPPPKEFPFPRPAPAGRPINRSPPPKRTIARSPPPRRLFGQSPTRLRSPPPQVRLRSPRGSPTNMGLPPVGLTINRLAQRPKTDRTASLPHTPNPFFRNFKVGSPSISNVASGAVTPATDDPPRTDMHVRGPVDIVIGLEKKRQKRKEKFWRQHCRKAAKEQAERKTVRGRGAERMKELGLECAERTRGYGLGQQTQLVISL